MTRLRAQFEPPTSDDVIIPPRPDTKEMLDFVIKPLQRVENGREHDTIAAIIAWCKALSPSTLPLHHMVLLPTSMASTPYSPTANYMVHDSVTNAKNDVPTPILQWIAAALFPKELHYSIAYYSPVLRK